MTGPDSWRGDDAFEGAHLAVNALNRALPEDRPMYELITLDDRGEAQEATRLVRELAGSTRTQGIIYAGPPEALPPAEEALATTGIPAIICYGDLYGARLLSAHVFQASPSLLWEARRIVDYALVDRGYARVGLLSSTTINGQTARRSLTLALQEEGASLAASATYEGELKKATKLLKQLRAQRVQALVVEADPPDTVKVLKALDSMGAGYTNSAQAKAAAPWRPHVMGFDLTVSPQLADADPPAGTIGSDTYARGVHYLPIPNFERFKFSFAQWWDADPVGWERRAYDAARMIGWAVDKARGARQDLAAILERMRRVRFSGLDITLGPDDHTTVDQPTVGLWVVPRPAAAVRESDYLPGSMPWVPLARGFSIDGERTDILPRDWKWLFRNAPPQKRPAPKLDRSLFGVRTPASDPIH